MGEELLETPLRFCGHRGIAELTECAEKVDAEQAGDDRFRRFRIPADACEDRLQKRARVIAKGRALLQTETETSAQASERRLTFAASGNCGAAARSRSKFFWSYFTR